MMRWMRLPGDTVSYLGAVALVVFVAASMLDYSFTTEEKSI